MTAEISGYWTFFCNPATWEIDRFLLSNQDVDTYQVSLWYKDHIKPGQLGVIRVGVDNRTKRQLQGRTKLSSGIYAIVQILEVPKSSADVSPFYVNNEDQSKEKLRVKIHYVKNLLKAPLLLKDLKYNAAVVSDNYLIKGFQSSTMPLRKEAFDEIIYLLNDSDDIFNNIEIESIDEIEDISKLLLKYEYASPQVKEVISRRIERGTISSAIKKIYEYKCKVCEALQQNPLSFKKTNGEHYIETHHIIHVSKLTEGSLGISNLITVCANHHRQFHFGNIEILENVKEKLTIKIDGQETTIEKKKFSFT